MNFSCCGGRWRSHEQRRFPVITLVFSDKCFPSRFPKGGGERRRPDAATHQSKPDVSPSPTPTPTPFLFLFFFCHRRPNSRNPRTRSPSADCEHLLVPINNAPCSHSEGKMPRASFVLPPSENNILTIFFPPSPLLSFFLKSIHRPAVGS